MEYVLGLDLGTSSLKGIVVNKQGKVILSKKADYSMKHIKTGYSEQNPNDWIKACKKILKELSAYKDIISNIAGVSFSGQMHSLVLLDDKNQVLRDAILWNDVRNTKQCNYIMNEFGNELLNITYNVALEGFTLPKILWVQENEPEIWEKVNKILLPKDYLRYWLTKEFHMDYSDASGTLLMDSENKIWSKEILDKFNIPEHYMPILTNSAGYISDIRPEIAQEYGMSKITKVFAGGADNACAALGAGIIDSRSNMISIGTSGVVLQYEDKPNESYNGKLHVFHHATDDDYYSMGVTLSAGHSLSWFKDVVNPDSSFEDFIKDISEIRSGAEGLLYAPYLLGERTPHMDSTIRGSFIGLDNKHTSTHLKRAVVEGITYSLKDSQTIMYEASHSKPTDYVLVGGGAKNSVWTQINANIFDGDIKTLTSEEGPGLGATMLAAMGLGWFSTYDECVNAFVHYNNKVHPEKEEAHLYGKLYKVYQKIYKQTKLLSNEISKIYQ